MHSGASTVHRRGTRHSFEMGRRALQPPLPSQSCYRNTEVEAHAHTALGMALEVEPFEKQHP